MRPGGVEEQGVEGRAVEAFAHVRAGAGDQERGSVRVAVEAGLRGGTALDAPAATQDDRIVSGVAQEGGDPFQVAGPVRQDQAVPAAAERGDHVGGDLPGTVVVAGQVAVDLGDAPGPGRVGVAAIAVPRWVNMQDRDRTAGAGHDQGAWCGGFEGDGDGVPDRPLTEFRPSPTII